MERPACAHRQRRDSQAGAHTHAAQLRAPGGDRCLRRRSWSA